MLLRVLFVACFAAFAGASLVGAQTLAQIGGPKELPPSGYPGQTYIDSRGCVFLRAGVDGQVNWVPRVSSDRKALCGYPPTFGAHPRVPVATETEVAAAAAPVAKPVVATTPAPVVRTAAPVVVAATVPTTRPATTASATPRGCPASAPYARMTQMADGRQAMVCSANRTAAVAPAPVVAAPPVTVRAASAEVMPPLPRGYKRAWTDDRLNVYRGVGTSLGQAQQDRIWTRTVPAELVTEVPVTRVTSSTRNARVTASSMSSAAAPAPQVTGSRYVQVGTFAQPGNADGAAGRLAAQGLPVSRSKITSGGKAMQIVLAGPFATTAEAQAGLAAARRAGFGDAFLR